MPLNIYTSNRMENLVDALAGVLKEPLASPFTPELLVVQSKGMQRWIAMQLASRLGVWANCEYPFPNKMASQLFARTISDLSDTLFFSAGTMTWKIMDLIPDLLVREEFAPLEDYLRGDGDGLKLFQLAGKIADTFDQYSFFRPELLLAWDEGTGGDWQEILWREISRCGNGQHRGQLKHRFTQALELGDEAGGSLPERITVFGVSYLPQYHLDILAQAATLTCVNLFLLSPCREYWGDIVSPREMARRSPEERPYLAQGNPLLASLGKLARDFSDMVLEVGGAVGCETDLYRDPGARTLLLSLQSDILNLRDPAGGGERRPIAPEDRSLQIHSCHTALREIEVLHDHLLALLAANENLECRDIVVMTPDIESYAPYISMVFEGASDPAKRIPYSIADRSLASEGAVAGVLLKLLALAGGRLTAAGVFDILESPPVSRRFGLDARELELARGWIEDTRIRWGVDEGHRVSLGLPCYRENTWNAGLDRLFLGYAMPEEGDLLFNGLLPYDEIEGDGARTLGKFADFVKTVTRLSRALCSGRTLGEWREELQALLGTFIDPGDDLAHEMAAVTKVVNTLEECGERAGFGGKVELAVIRSWISSRLGEEEQGIGFLTGSVTFCAMLPMRSIPFRVVALVGMSDTSFPRQGRPPGFDLIARSPRRGDRSLRDEDRYLFLECLMSARDFLYLSYVGQSVKDNGVIPPSVLVSELLDAVAAGFSVPGGKLEERLVTRHRLQPFSRSYFLEEGDLFSYSDENCSALREAALGPGSPEPFLVTALREPLTELRKVSLGQLVSFFGNPAKYLLEKRLGIKLDEVSTPLEEREAFAVEGLDAYGIKQELLEKRLQGEGVADFLAVTRCRGLLPPARHGEFAFAQAVREVDELAAAVKTQSAGLSPLDPFSFTELLGPFTLSGRIDGNWTERRIAYRCAKIKAKDEIKLWIEHLALNAFAPLGYPRESLLVMKDKMVRFTPVDGAREILASLLDCYWRGHGLPLRFFPASSLEYVLTGFQLEKAHKKWERGFNYPGEGDDPHFSLCFGREEEPLNSDFEACAREVLDPLVLHRQEERL